MRSVIITAGGIGKRMGGNLPKQFLPINGQPILMHTIQRFYQFDSALQLLLTLPEDWISFWKDLCQEHGFAVPHEIVVGGKERFHSIQNALETAKGDIVAVHDGVRPFVSEATIQRCFDEVVQTGAVIPVIPVSESLRMEVGDKSQAVDRANYRIVQTPQVFNKVILTKAYQQSFETQFTDDASLVEAQGVNIHLIDGNPENIKITTPLDLKLAELLV